MQHKLHILHPFFFTQADHFQHAGNAQLDSTSALIRESLNDNFEIFRLYIREFCANLTTVAWRGCIVTSMEEDLRNTLIVTKDKTQYDMKAKRILARKSVLSHILAATVDEFKGMPIKEVAKHIEGGIYN